MERNPSPDPNCPHCRGTGRRILFQLPEPCGCVEPTAVAGASEYRVTLDELANCPIVAEWCRQVEKRERAHIDRLLGEITDRAPEPIGTLSFKHLVLGEWPPAPPKPGPIDLPLVYSERLRIAEEAVGWLNRVHGCSSDPANIVTALGALGYLRRKPGPAQAEPARSIFINGVRLEPGQGVHTPTPYGMMAASLDATGRHVSVHIIAEWCK